MFRHVTVSLMVLTLLAASTAARAQDRLDMSGLEVNLHGGGAFLDGLERNDWYGGVTALLHFGSGVGLGGTVDRVGTTVEVGDEDFDATIWYYSGDLSYAFPSVTQAQFYGFIGAGIARFQPGDELEDVDTEDESDFMVPVGVGVRWLNQKADPSWGATLEVRDRVIYVDEEETKVSNDWSISLGLSLVLGG